ncbi:hypothetical protein FA15DRAFT_708280 [Coprinopsis marcescibilis]|uniref:Uncharacterized protein n=1 Tax=Coprinopsis marcescibilis TaxID=230819 RepID=A0A5C3KK41_COPMA|nr:hypothetical protein FA15DRAFT_708280 [Coprinopsis marcescibilis]
MVQGSSDVASQFFTELSTVSSGLPMLLSPIGLPSSTTPTRFRLAQLSDHLGTTRTRSQLMLASSMMHDYPRRYLTSKRGVETLAAQSIGKTHPFYDHPTRPRLSSAEDSFDSSLVYLGQGLATLSELYRARVETARSCVPGSCFPVEGRHQLLVCSPVLGTGLTVRSGDNDRTRHPIRRHKASPTTP